MAQKKTKMRLRVGIIGIGRIGRFHYRIYKKIKGIGKICPVDTNPKTLSLVTGDSYSDYKKLLGKVDLVSIATPTASHFEIASFFLKNRIPALVEKPLTNTLKETNKLIDLSGKKKTLLFVGHVERYNNAYLAIKKLIKHPKFIECHRLSFYPKRSLDISVVLDLMIHDLDIVLDLVKDPISKIEAKGVRVLSSKEDIANVRIAFKNGCVANITSSRISAKKERKLRIFTKNCYISLDYAQQKVEIYQKKGKQIIKKTLPINKKQPLEKEISEFVNLVRKKVFTLEYAKKAKDALALSLIIQKKIETHT